MDNQSLTPIEVAEQLQIAKNTVYELIKRGELPAYKVGRKVRIDTSDLEAYKNRGKSTGHNTNQIFSQLPSQALMVDTQLPAPSNTKSLIISGHDACLDVLASFLRQEMPAYPILRAHTNSYRSLVDLYMGDTHIAASHLYDATTNEYNIPYCKTLLPGTPIIIITLATRLQGLYVHKHNPKQIKSWTDLIRKEVQMINREKGSGSRVLLDEKLKELHIEASQINGYDNESTSGMMAATHVATGKVDCAIGCEHMVKHIPSIDFIPLQQESYDIIIPKKAMTEVIYKVIYDIVNSKDYKETIALLVGCDTTYTGDIVYES